VKDFRPCRDDAGIGRIELCSNGWALYRRNWLARLKHLATGRTATRDREHNAAVAHFISAGTISHFAFLHGWIRSERQWELTIVKPDQGLTVVANLRNKTMQVIDEHTSPETIVIDTAEGLPQPALIGEIVTERLPDATISQRRTLPRLSHNRNHRLEECDELVRPWTSPNRLSGIRNRPARSAVRSTD
jgi:hypothetical protein